MSKVETLPGEARRPSSNPSISIGVPLAPVYAGVVKLAGGINPGWNGVDQAPWGVDSVTVGGGSASFTSHSWEGMVSLGVGKNIVTAVVDAEGHKGRAQVEIDAIERPRTSVPPTIGIVPPKAPVIAGALQLQGIGNVGLDGATNAPWAIQSITVQVDQGPTVAAQWNGTTEFTWSAAVDLSPGKHTITVTVYTNGPSASAAIQVEALPHEEEAPTISIVPPSAPVIAGALQLQGAGGAGVDRTGAPWTIQSITVQVDQGTTVVAQWSGTTELTWSATVELSPGAHTVTATVHTNGPSASAVIQIEATVPTAVPVKGWEIISTTAEFGAGEGKVIVVNAPVGKRVVGGGYFPVSQQGALRILGSWPSDPSGTMSTDGKAWSVYALNTMGQASSPKPSLTVYAVCAEIEGMEVITETATFAPGESKDVLVACPPGKRIVGGGWFPKDEQETLHVEGSWPSDAQGSRTSTDGSTWAVYARNPDTTPSNIPPSLVVYAICADEAEGWQVVTIEGQFTDAKMRDVSLSCPSGKHILSGGFVTQLGMLEIEANAPSSSGDAPPDGTSWIVYATNLMQSASSLVAHVICARAT